MNNETAEAWVLVIRERWDRITLIEFEQPITAGQAWAQARRKMTLEGIEAVTEVLATPVHSMQKVNP